MCSSDECLTIQEEMYAYYSWELKGLKQIFVFVSLIKTYKYITMFFVVGICIFFSVLIRFRVQFGINLHGVSFSKSWNCSSCWGECNFNFLKDSQVQINFKLNEKIPYNYLLEEVPKDLSWSHFYAFEKFLSSFYVISRAEKNSHCLSANHSPVLRCVICPSVTLFALVLCNPLGQSESIYFLCILLTQKSSSISLLIAIS